MKNFNMLPLNKVAMKTVSQQLAPRIILNDYYILRTYKIAFSYRVVMY